MFTKPLANTTALFITPNYEKRYNIGNHHFKEELGRRFGNTVFYGPGYKWYNDKRQLEEVVKKFDPDVLLLMFPTRMIERREPLALLKYQNFVGPKIIFDTDAQSSIWPRCKFINKIDADCLFLGNNYQYINDHKKLLDVNCDVYWSPFGVNENYFKIIRAKRYRPFGFLGCTNEIWYSDRIHMVAVMKRCFGAKFHFTPSNRIQRENYVKFLNETNIFVSAGDRAKGFFMKYLEAMACGCMLLSQYTPAFDRLGFIDGVHLKIYKDFSEMVDLAKYYLLEFDEREKIAEQGRNFVLRKNTWKHRVDRILGLLGVAEYEEDKYIGRES